MPFPYIERERSQARPALIVSGPAGGDMPLFWTLMVTSARRGAWPGDIDVGPEHATFGLPVRCYVRTAKIATLEIGMIERRLGSLPAELLRRVGEQLRMVLHWT